MAKTRTQKEEIVAELERAIRTAPASVFVKFTGITVAKETDMRRALREVGVGYLVAKKTLIRRALEALGHAHKDIPLEGEVAIAYNAVEEGDAILPAGKIYAYGKEFGADKFSIVGGVFQGEIKDAVMMQEIAMIPPINTLRGMFVNIINSPIQRFATVLDQVAKRERA